MRLNLRAVLISIFLLVTAGVISFIPFFKASPEKLKAQFTAEVQALIGEKAEAKSAKLTFFPTPKFILNDVTIGENAWLKAEQLAINTGFLGLWSNSLSKHSLELTKAVIDDVTLSEKGFDRLKLLMLLDSSQLFGKINFIDSEITLKILNEELTLSDFEGEMSFEKTTAPFKIKGTAFYNNEKINFAINLDKPQAAFIPQKTSTFYAKIIGKDTEITLESEANLIEGFAFSGVTTAKRRDITLKAKSDYSAKALTLKDLAIKGKGLEGEGVLSFEPHTKKLFGTLFFKELTLNESFDANNAPSMAIIQEFLPIAQQILPLTSLDLRISIEKLNAFKLQLEQVSAVLIGNSQAMKLSPLVFKQQGGEYKGEVSVAQNALKLNLTGQNVNFHSLFPTMKIEGKGDIAMQMLINDNTFPYQTDVKFALKDGSAHYGNLEERLLEAIRRPLSRSNIVITKGSTKFQSLRGQVSFDATKWNIVEPLLLETARFTARIEGNGENDKLNLSGLSRLKALGIEMPYSVTGLTKEPRLSFTPQDAINRSPATRPLREAARDENAINAVRDIMNRQAPNLAPSEMPNSPFPLRLP